MIMTLVKRAWYFLFYRLKWSISFLRYKQFGNGSVIKSPILTTPSSISIGKNVFIMDLSRIEAVNEYNNSRFSPHIVISDGVSIQQALHLTCSKSVFIGTNTAIAAFVTITDIHHPYEDINLPIEQQDIITREVYIGEDCKIYNNAVILPGTKLNKHCTVGANSVVSGEFPSFSVIVGAPAKVVKRYCFETNKWRKVDDSGNFKN